MCETNPLEKCDIAMLLVYICGQQDSISTKCFMLRTLSRKMTTAVLRPVERETSISTQMADHCMKSLCLLDCGLSECCSGWCSLDDSHVGKAEVGQVFRCSVIMRRALLARWLLSGSRCGYQHQSIDQSCGSMGGICQGSAIKNNH